jgi:hypothetical protein
MRRPPRLSPVALVLVALAFSGTPSGASNSQHAMARTWPLRYLIRHTAFHTMDHARALEDKDLDV